MPAHGPHTQITLSGARLAKSQQTGADAHIGGSRCARGMRHCSLNVTVMVGMTCRVPGPRPGRERPPLTCPSGAAVSGPELPAPYLREEDPPCCRRWRRARDALRARALGRWHGSGAGQAGEGASCHVRVGCISSPPSTRRPQAAGPGCRPGVSPLTRPPLRAVPAATCSCAHGGCWPRCAVALAALATEVAGGAPGSARRRRRTDHSPAGRRRRVIACGRRQAPADRPCRRCRARRRRFSGPDLPADTLQIADYLPLL
jgi:hypothetical protein